MLSVMLRYLNALDADSQQELFLRYSFRINSTLPFFFFLYIAISLILGTYPWGGDSQTNSILVAPAWVSQGKVQDYYWLEIHCWFIHTLHPRGCVNRTLCQYIRSTRCQNCYWLACRIVKFYSFTSAQYHTWAEYLWSKCYHRQPYSVRSKFRSNRINWFDFR